MSRYHVPIDNFVLRPYPAGSITQFYGENLALYAHVCNDIGMCLKGHGGLDIVDAWGVPIYAVSDQKVVEVKEDPGGYGRHVRCLDEKFEWTYAHMSSIACKKLQELKAGDLIGKLGNSGFVVSGATPFWKYNPYKGSHLHLQAREYSSKGPDYITYTSGVTAHIKNYKNGFFGAIDIAPLFEETDEEIKMRLLLTTRSLANNAVDLLRKLIARKQK